VVEYLGKDDYFPLGVSGKLKNEVGEGKDGRSRKGGKEKRKEMGKKGKEGGKKGEGE